MCFSPVYLMICVIIYLCDQIGVIYLVIPQTSVCLNFNNNYNIHLKEI